MTAWYRTEGYDWDTDKMFWSEWKELPEGVFTSSHRIDITFQEPVKPLEDGIYVTAASTLGGNSDYNVFKKEVGVWTRLVDSVWVGAHIAEGDDFDDLVYVGAVSHKV